MGAICSVGQDQLTFCSVETSETSSKLAVFSEIKRGSAAELTGVPPAMKRCWRLPLRTRLQPPTTHCC